MEHEERDDKGNKVKDQKREFFQFKFLILAERAFFPLRIDNVVGMEWHGLVNSTQADFLPLLKTTSQDTAKSHNPFLKYSSTSFRDQSLPEFPCA